MQEKRNSSALAMELRLSRTNPLRYDDGLMQDYCICRALAMEIVQSCTEPSIQ